MILPILQQDIQFFAQPDPTQNTVTLIVFGALVVAGVIAAVINSRRKGSGSTRAGGVLRQARKLGLPPDQRAELKELVKTLRLQNPQRLITNTAYLNHALRRRMDQIDVLELPEAERERKKGLLFAAKRHIENAKTRHKVMSSSREIRVGQDVRVTDTSGTTQQLMVASNVHNGLGIELPYSARSGRLEYQKGTQLKVSVVVEPDKLYSFATRVIGLNNTRGASAMFVEHVSNIPQTQQRRSPRREYDSPCYFYPVTVLTVGKGRRAKKQAFVNTNKRIFGRFEDLSAGGCAIRTQSPLTGGSILKVDFQNSDGSPVSVYGMVRSVERQRARGKLMHIKFTRVSRKHLNQIQSYVYGLSEV
jgi:c-di-GMP-binding flagellar brake protein YcgR